MKVLITICDRSKSEYVLDLLNHYELYYQVTCYGKGTANSEILSYFGLAETEKEVIFSFVSLEAVNEIFKEYSTKEEFANHGAVAFTLNLDSLGKKTLHFVEQLAEVRNEQK